MDLATFHGLVLQLSAAYERLHQQAVPSIPASSPPICLDAFSASFAPSSFSMPEEVATENTATKVADESPPSKGERYQVNDWEGQVAADDTGQSGGRSRELTTKSKTSSDAEEARRVPLGAVDCADLVNISPAWHRRSSPGRSQKLGSKSPDALLTTWAEFIVQIIEQRRRSPMRRFWEEGEATGSYEDPDATSEDEEERDVVFGAMVESRKLHLRSPLGEASHGSSVLSNLEATHAGGCSRVANKFILSPYSSKKSVWMMVGALVVFIDFFMLTLTVFGLSLESDESKGWDLFNSLFWSCDMLLVFMTGVLVHAEVVVSFSAIARHYLARWFLFDATMLSIGWMLVIIDRQTTGDWGALKVKTLKYVKFLKYFRLLRIAKIEGLVRKALEIVNSVHMLSILKIIGHLLTVILYLHCSATAFYAVSKVDGSLHWAVSSAGHSVSTAFPLNYFMSIHWTVAQLQGTCDIYPGQTVGERAFAAGHLFLSVAVMALLFGNLAALMNQMLQVKAKKEHWVNTARHYLEANHISKKLCLRVRTQVGWAQVHTSDREHNANEIEVLQLLTASLRAELLEAVRKPVLLRHCVFQALRNTHTRSWQRLICDALGSVAHVSGEFLFHCGHTCESMRFVTSGEILYSRYNSFLEGALKYGGRQKFGRTGTVTIRDLVDAHRSKRAVTLDNGATLCEASLWVDWVHCGEGVAVGRVSVLSLKFEDFAANMQLDPVMKSCFSVNAQRFARVVNFVGKDKADDLTTSAQVMEMAELLMIKKTQSQASEVSALRTEVSTLRTLARSVTGKMIHRDFKMRA